MARQAVQPRPGEDESVTTEMDDRVGTYRKRQAEAAASDETVDDLPESKPKGLVDNPPDADGLTRISKYVRVRRKSK